MVSHARSAVRAGHNVTVAVSGDWNPQTGSPAPDELSVVSFAHARSADYDAAIATWWQDVLLLPQLTATRHIQFIQAPEDLLYRPDHSSFGLVRDLYRIPVPAVTIAGWLAEHLQREYGRDRPAVVMNGVNKSVFRPDGPTVAPRSPDRLRVLVEGPLGVWNKNVLPALRLSRSHADETWLLTPTAVGAIAGVDRVFSRLPPSKVASVYRSCDVLLKLSTVEGFSMPPLEMFHCGGTSVVFDAPGPTEYADHGHNALIAPLEDFGTAGEYLSDLRHDRILLDRLKAGALDTAAAWPSEAEAGQRFLDVVSSFPGDGSRALTSVRGELESLARLVLTQQPSPLIRLRRHSLVRSLHCSMQLWMPVDANTQRLRLPFGRWRT